MLYQLLIYLWIYCFHLFISSITFSFDKFTFLDLHCLRKIYIIFNLRNNCKSIIKWYQIIVAIPWYQPGKIVCIRSFLAQHFPASRLGTEFYSQCSTFVVQLASVTTLKEKVSKFVFVPVLRDKIISLSDSNGIPPGGYLVRKRTHSTI